MAHAQVYAVFLGFPDGITLAHLSSTHAGQILILAAPRSLGEAASGARFARVFSPTTMKLPYRLLVLDDDEHALSGLVELLRGEGHQVTPCSTYADAQLLLSANSYDLLVTDVRLRSFNGLHLAAKTRSEQPDIGIIIMTAYEDAMMEIEARRYNAHFVRKPIKPDEFLQAVASSLGNVRRQRRWPRKQVSGGFRVTVGGTPAAVMDVCYGGLRLQLANLASLPPRFAIEVSGIGLNLEVQPVWSYPAGDGSVVCGAALAAENTAAARTWRTIVDRLNA